MGITIKIINIVKAIFLTLAFTVFYLFLLHGSNESFKLIGIQSQSQFSYLLLAYLCIFSVALAYNNKIGILNAKFDTLYYLSKENYHDFYFNILGVFSYVFVGTVLATFVVMQIEPIANQEISSSSMISFLRFNHAFHPFDLTFGVFQNCRGFCEVFGIGFLFK